MPVLEARRRIRRGALVVRDEWLDVPEPGDTEQRQRNDERTPRGDGDREQRQRDRCVPQALDVRAELGRDHEREHARREVHDEEAEQRTRGPIRARHQRSEHAERERENELAGVIREPPAVGEEPHQNNLAERGTGDHDGGQRQLRPLWPAGDREPGEHEHEEEERERACGQCQHDEDRKGNSPPLL